MSTYFFCCDIGGTNTSIGILEKKDTNDYTLLEVKRYASQKIEDINTIVLETLQYFKKKFFLTSSIPLCISAAGPTDGETCALSNLEHWTIDRKTIEQKLKSPVLLINDFTAIAYSLMVLTSKNKNQLVQIAHPNNIESTHQKETIKLVLGAGTGLGISLLSIKDNSAAIIPTEGGWRNFCPNDELSLQYYMFLSENAKKACYWEDAICGSRGIPSICKFFIHTSFNFHHDYIPTQEERNELKYLFEHTKQEDLSPLISQRAHDDGTVYKKIMQFWTKLYATCSCDTATMCLPLGGIYIAGGIAIKNIQFFIKDDLFYQSFMIHDNTEVKKILSKIPIYIVRDYNASLYGDAFLLDTTFS